MKKEPSRITVSLPAELSGEANQVASETGVSLSDLLRQGIIRILLERRQRGTVQLMKLPQMEATAA